MRMPTANRVRIASIHSLYGQARRRDLVAAFFPWRLIHAQVPVRANPPHFALASHEAAAPP